MKMKPVFLAAAFLLTACATNPNRPMWETKEDFRRAEPEILALIEAFSKDPLGPEAPRQRYIVNKWGMMVPYIGFTVLGKYLSEMDTSYRYHSVLYDAFAFGEMKLKLEGNREAKEPEIASASLENMLKVYRNIVQADPDAKSGLLEGYFEMQAAGKLVGHFAHVTAVAKRPGSRELPAHFDAVDYGMRMRGQKGEETRLDQWKERKLMVVYVSYSCPHCAKNLEKLMAGTDKTDPEILVLFSGSNSPRQAEEFMAENKCGYRYFIDHKGDFHARYGGGIVPVSLLIKKDGSAERMAGMTEERYEALLAEYKKRE
jgi:hypothetical protein